MQFIEQPGAEIQLGYWAIRGLAQPIRFLLAMAEVPYSEVRLGVTQDGAIIEEESADWAAHKATLDLAFPNLPYLIDTSGSEPVQLTQSNAVIRYLARQFGFYGDCESDRIAIDVLQEEAYDFRNKIVSTAYTLGEDYPAAYAEFVETAAPRHLDGFEKYLSNQKSNTHFVGNGLSLVDFVLYELIWQTSLMVPDSVTENNRPNLYQFIKIYEAQPQIVAYMKDSHYIERPINSPWASFA